MATQKRYFNYMAPITSKGVGEHVAMAVCIGPLLGFDRATVDLGTGNLIITSSNDDENLPNKLKDIYTTNENMAIQIPSHIVVTPDGILTTIQGALNLSFNPAMVGLHKEFMVIANHNYIASESGNPVTFTCIPNSTNNSYSAVLTGLNCNISNWYAIANIIGNIEKNKSVIVGYYSVDSSNIVTAYNPYRNAWPQPYPITSLEYKALQNRDVELENKVVGLESMIASIPIVKIIYKSGIQEAFDAGKLGGDRAAVGTCNFQKLGDNPPVELTPVKFPNENKWYHGNILVEKYGDDIVRLNMVTEMAYRANPDGNPEGLLNASFRPHLNLLSAYVGWNLVGYQNSPIRYVMGMDAAIGQISIADYNRNSGDGDDIKMSSGNVFRQVAAGGTVDYWQLTQGGHSTALKGLAPMVVIRFGFSMTLVRP